MATITPEIAERPAAAQPGPEKLSAAKRLYPGALVVVEGIDGSGKSTQLYLLKRWLEIGGYRISFHGMEFVAAGEIGHAARQAAAAADAHDVFDVACRRFCRPLRTTNPAFAAWRLSGSCRPVHLYGFRARCSARLFGALATKSVQLRAHSGHHVLLSRAARRGREPDRGRAAQAEILRGRDGPRNFARPRGEFPDLSGKDSEQLRPDD